MDGSWASLPGHVCAVPRKVDGRGFVHTAGHEGDLQAGKGPQATGRSQSGVIFETHGAKEESYNNI